MNKFLNKEFFSRAISVVIFVPLVILPILYSNYAALIVNLFFASVILNEIRLMRPLIRKTYILNIYLFLTISSFFLFLFLLIAKESTELLLMLILIIWLFDTFSYLGGKIFGGMKLMPKISAGKTVSGLITGTVMSIILTMLILNNLIKYELSIYFIALIIVLSFFGDTLVSILKRYASIKDTGNIMPGHGGLLDRFDSFIAVFFVIGTLNLIK